MWSVNSTFMYCTQLGTLIMLHPCPCTAASRLSSYELNANSEHAVVNVIKQRWCLRT
jgi:hypothetical protein